MSGNKKIDQADTSSYLARIVSKDGGYMLKVE